MHRLCTVSGLPGSPARVGVSVVDISTGLNAHAAIVTALLARVKTGRGAALKTSLFASATELMAVPGLQMVRVNMFLVTCSYGANACGAATTDGDHDFALVLAGTVALPCACRLAGPVALSACVS